MWKDRRTADDAGWPHGLARSTTRSKTSQPLSATPYHPGVAISSVRTKLPLATWAKILGIHPLHFEQVAFTPGNRSPAVCDAGLLQYDWQQADQVSRSQIAQAIADAEFMIESVLGYRLAPSWEIDEWQMSAQPYQRELVNYNGRAIPIFRSGTPTRWKDFISGGVEARSLIEADAPIVWSDADGDGDDDTGTITTTVTAGTSACELELYYPGHSGDPGYQIRPVTASVSGTTATITFKRELAVLESILEAFTPSAAEWTDDADFLAEVDVYRHYNDPSTQVTLMWEPSGICGACDGVGCEACAYAVQTGCLFLRSTPRTSFVAWTPATWDADAESFTAASLAQGRGPDLLRLYYYAGHRDRALSCPTTTMSDEWARVVTYLSLALIDRPACQCTSDVWDYWRDIEDLGKSNAAIKEALNPFGVMRGARYAWQRVKQPDAAALRYGAVV